MEGVLPVHEVVFKDVLNGSTISGAMIKHGYAETTASSTGKLTNTKGWKILCDKYLSDGKLLKKHNELLFGNNKAISLGALNIAYKIKGKFPKESNVFAFQFNAGDKQEYAISEQ